MIMAILCNFWWVALIGIFALVVLDALIERYCKDKEKAWTIAGAFFILAIILSGICDFFHSMGCF